MAGSVVEGVAIGAVAAGGGGVAPGVGAVSVGATAFGEALVAGAAMVDDSSARKLPAAQVEIKPINKIEKRAGQ
jgi:hypothetical protein